jgi:ssDNA-binding Zn-finger/Zn-ribbon topoisomerase 1
MFFVDYKPLPECLNVKETYREICVQCNKCGRFKEKEEDRKEDD